MTDDGAQDTKVPAARQQRFDLSWNDETPPAAKAEARPAASASVAAAPGPTADVPAMVASARSAARSPAAPVPEANASLAAAAAAAPAASPVASLPPYPAEARAARVVELGQVSMSCGQRLQEARGTANLTVAQVSQKTRIPKPIIEQLETERYAELPPAIYTRSHLAQLCRLYGLDAAPLLEEFSRAAEHSTGAEREMDGVVMTSQPTASGARVRCQIEGPSASALGRRRGPSITMILVGGVIILLTAVALVAVGVQQYRHRQGLAHPESATPGAAAPPQIRFEDFVVPQALPLKRVPFPER